MAESIADPSGATDPDEPARRDPRRRPRRRTRANRQPHERPPELLAAGSLDTDSTGGAARPADRLRDDDRDRSEDPDVVVAAVGDVEEADLEGDRPFAPGTARAALSSSRFRRVYFGWLGSNIGTWMQNVVLTAWAYGLTESPTFVSIVLFAQLGPLLLFSLIGGSLADRFDRRKLLILASLQQATFALILAAIATSPDPSKVAIVLVVFGIGVGQSVAGPTFSSALPTLVDKRDLPGAVSLTSANMNISRVIGAAVGAFVYEKWGVPWVFAANALTYLFIVGSIASIRIPRFHPPADSPTGWRRLVQGFSVARHDYVVGRVLLTCATFSFFCLIFVGQMPTLAETNLQIDEKSVEYGWLYAAFGMGALLGALSLGTVFAGRDLTRLIRVGLAGFAALLAVLAVWRVPAPAYPTIFVLGFFYFMTITSLSTVLQQRLDEHTRGRVMAIWIMAFGGTVPLGNLFFGPIITATNITVVLGIGVVVALFLVWFADLRDRAEMVA